VNKKNEESKQENGKKVMWYDARNLKNKEQILPLLYSLRFEYLVVKVEELDKIKPPHKIKLVVEVKDAAAIEKLTKEVIVLSANPELLQKAMEKGLGTALHKRVENQEDMELAWQMGNNFDYVIVELIDDTNIPLELIIARLQNRKTILMKIVENVQDAEIAYGVMEAGSDGVVLKTEDVNEIVKADKFMLKNELGKIDLCKAVVVDVQHIGMGYRSCIDTTTLMKQNEGMLIGSTSNGGLLVSSETHFLPYMELRPFRVNAGAVHSYVWAPELMTAYLTELKGGSKLLCVDTYGNTREVSVGRVKTEIRPLLKIEAEAKGIRINAIVQDDWHIRILGGSGEPRNASTIKPGDELLAYVCAGGRHVGVKIDENLEEK